MSTVKNGQILPYCHFNKIIKGPGTSFQSPALGQKHVRNICQTTHQYLTKFHFGRTQDSKEISISQSVIQNFRAASGIFKKRTVLGSFTHKYLRITLFLEERALFCQLLLGAASDYWMLISFGLFLVSVTSILQQCLC